VNPSVRPATPAHCLTFAHALVLSVTLASRLGATPLTWSPPAGLEHFVPVEVPPAGGLISFPRNDTDYRIHSRELIRGSVTLQGGRNIVWIGGHIRIDRDDATNGRIIQAEARRGLLIDDGRDASVVDSRIVFIEGLRIDGNDLAEGIDIRAPKAEIILQNIGIDTVRLRGFDDRDSTGDYARNLPKRNHPDLLQPYGGYKALRVDGFSGRTNYQAMFFVADVRFAPGGGFYLHPGYRPGDIWLRRVDMIAVETADESDPSLRHAGHMGLCWYGDGVGRIFVDNSTVWYRHHVNSGWGTLAGFRRGAYRDAHGRIHVQPVSGESEFRHNFKAGPNYPTTLTTSPYASRAGTDALGDYATWSDEAVLSDGRPAFRDWSDKAAGRIYSGSPQEGTYVPLSAVGLEYRSPGYANLGAPAQSGRGSR